MGLFDDFDIDMDEVEEAGGFSFEDGTYDFEIAEALTQNGTKNKPDTTFFIIKYALNDGEAGTYWEWFTVAVDGSSEHANAKRSLGFLKSRLMDLGFKASQLNDIDGEDLEGITGTLKLVTTSGKCANAANKYQNVRDVKVGADETEEEAPKPRRTAAKAKTAPSEDEDLDEIKKRVAAKRAARAKSAADEAEEEDDEPEEEAPKPAPRRRRAAAKVEDSDDEDENPFGD